MNDLVQPFPGVPAVLRFRADAVGVEAASEVRTTEDLGLNTVIEDWARLERRDPDELSAFLDFYQEVVTLHGGTYQVIEHSESSAEIVYRLPLWGYLVWNGQESYDRTALLAALDAAAPDAGLEDEYRGGATLVRHRFHVRLDVLEHRVAELRETLNGPSRAPSERL